jgi:biotin transport system substrate-specific component
MAHLLTYDRAGTSPLAHAPGRTLGLVLASTVLVAICAHISIPLFYTPVPITLQTFAVFFLGLVLGPRLGFAALSLYLVEGAAGLPVFSPHGAGGMAQLFGPTGGYLLSYPLAAAVCGWIGRRSGFARAAWAAAVGSLVVFLGGTTWLGFATHLGIRASVYQAILPFLPGDMLKVCAAAAAATAVRTIRKNRAQKP